MLLCGRLVGYNPNDTLDEDTKKKRDETTRGHLQERFGSWDKEIWNPEPEPVQQQEGKEEVGSGSSATQQTQGQGGQMGRFPVPPAFMPFGFPYMVPQAFMPFAFPQNVPNNMRLPVAGLNPIVGPSVPMSLMPNMSQGRWEQRKPGARGQDKRKRAPRRCLSCMKLGKEAEALNCPGRSGRFRCENRHLAFDKK